MVNWRSAELYGGPIDGSIFMRYNAEVPFPFYLNEQGDEYEPGLKNLSVGHGGLYSLELLPDVRPRYLFIYEYRLINEDIHIENVWGYLLTLWRVKYQHGQGTLNE